MACTHSALCGCAVQQSEEVAGDGVVVGLDLDALAAGGEVVPVEQHGAERGHQAVGDGQRGFGGVGLGFRDAARVQAWRAR